MGTCGLEFQCCTECNTAEQQMVVAATEALTAVEKLASEKKMQQLAEEAGHYILVLLLYSELVLGHVLFMLHNRLIIFLFHRYMLSGRTQHGVCPENRS